MGERGMMRLRTESHVAIDDDIVRREELSTVLELDRAEAQHRQRLLEDAERAHNQAQALVHNAQREAERLRSAARARFQRVARLGYAAGRRGALREWNMRSVRAMRDERQQWLRNRERLLQVVVDARRDRGRRADAPPLPPLRQRLRGSTHRGLTRQAIATSPRAMSSRARPASAAGGRPCRAR